MYAMCYSRAMEVSITQFRRDLFALVNRALEGEEVWVAHRGHRFRIAPDQPSSSRLNRLTPLEELTAIGTLSLLRIWDGEACPVLATTMVE